MNIKSTFILTRCCINAVRCGFVAVFGCALRAGLWFALTEEDGGRHWQDPAVRVSHPAACVTLIWATCTGTSRFGGTWDSSWRSTARRGRSCSRRVWANRRGKSCLRNTPSCCLWLVCFREWKKLGESWRNSQHSCTARSLIWLIYHSDDQTRIGQTIWIQAFPPDCRFCWIQRGRSTNDPAFERGRGTDLAKDFSLEKRCKNANTSLNTHRNVLLTLSIHVFQCISFLSSWSKLLCPLTPLTPVMLCWKSCQDGQQEASDQDHY